MKYINYISNNNQSKKSIDEIAREVIEGIWENGEDRKQKLQNAGYDFNEVQEKVNELLKNNFVLKQEYYPKSNYKGNSLGDALKKLGIDSSFKNRVKIASKNGIKVYIGLSSQNIKLLQLLKNGKLKK